LPKCSVCGKKEASAPKGEEKYCKECWTTRNAKLDIENGKFEVDRYLRMESTEFYFLRHEKVKSTPMLAVKS